MDEEIEQTPEELLITISNMLAQFGWVIAMKEETYIKGIVAGTKDYVSEVIADADDDYVIFVHGSEEEEIIH